MAALAALAFTTAAAIAFPTEVTYDFSASNPHSKLQTGLTALSFHVATENGKPVELVPELYDGFPEGSFQHAAIALAAGLTCEQEGLPSSADVGYFVQIGKFGEKGVPIRRNRLLYKGAASDGATRSGTLELRARFSRRGTVAAGTVLVKGAKALGEFTGEPVTGCHTGSGKKPKPLKWRLVGAL